MLSSHAAPAHEISPAIADAEIRGTRLTLGIDLTLETLLAGIDASAFADTNDSPEAKSYDRLRAMAPAELEAELRARWPRLSRDIVVESGGQRAALTLEGVTVPPTGDLSLPRTSHLSVSAVLPGSGPVTIGAAAAFGPVILRQTGAGPDAFAALLAPGEISPPLPRTGGAAEAGWTTFLRYIVLGFEHIVPKGLDHILFVLGLFFFSLKLRPLLLQITSFTAAHTVTLALATLGIVSVPSSVVEPLIAASIVFVAVENLMSDRLSPWRTGVVFCFGLLHGLGFASVLGDIGLGEGAFLRSLIGFNLGVECGQLSVIAVAWALVARPLGHEPWYRARVARPASVLIAATGAFWFVQRVFF